MTLENIIFDALDSHFIYSSTKAITTDNADCYNSKTTACCTVAKLSAADTDPCYLKAKKTSNTHNNQYLFKLESLIESS